MEKAFLNKSNKSRIVLAQELYDAVINNQPPESILELLLNCMSAFQTVATTYLLHITQIKLNF